MSATEINDLPNELLFSILKHLKVKEKPPCRLVCKRFLSVCDGIKVTELIISDTIENINDYWFSTNEPFNHKDAIDVDTFLALRSKFQPEMFLKRLHFKGPYADYQKLNVNEFTHIEQLTVEIVYRDDTDPVIHINLPNLKIMHDRCGSDVVFHLNTPKLETLNCSALYFTSVHFYHPDTIKHLELRHYFATAASLKNIEYLKVEAGFENIRLENHPQLERLECNLVFKYNDEDFPLMEAIRKLFKKKRHQLQIYFQSVKLVDVEKLEQYKGDNELAFKIRNYDLLADRVDCYDVQYNELMQLINDNLPNDFYKKYFDLRSISVTGNVKDTSHFIGFLKSFRYLSVIWMIGSHFDQSFYDFLPELDQLTAIGFGNMPEPITNFDFLFKMHRLRQIATNQDSKIFFNLAAPLFQQLKGLLNFTFCYEKDYFWISKTSNNSYFFQQKEVKEDGRKETIFEQTDVKDLSLLLTEFCNCNL